VECASVVLSGIAEAKLHAAANMIGGNPIMFVSLLDTLLGLLLELL
jgi:hypothetical protein